MSGAFVLAFDPGASLGWASIEAEPWSGKAVRVKLFARGVMKHPTAAEIGDVIYKHTAVGGYVAIEKVIGGGYAGAGKGAAAVSGALVETNWQGGLIAGIAFARGRKVVEMPAPTWRGVVCGRPGADRARIRESLLSLASSGLIVDFPKTTNDHVRDAIGCAIGAAWSLVK